MYRSYDVCDVESWTRQAIAPGPKRVAVRCAATSLVVLAAAAVAAGAWIGADPFDAADRGEGPPGSGIIVESEATHLWLPGPFALLARPEGRCEVLKDHEAFRRFLEENGASAIGFAVTYRGHRVDRLWTDATFIRRPYRELLDFQELKRILAGDVAEPNRRASMHSVSEAFLSLESAAMIEEMRRIAADGDLHREPTRASVPD
jgi:hypothetical protein